MVARYLARVSGPLLDRIDLQVVVPPVTYSEMSTMQPAESSATIAARVLATRRMQPERWGGADLNARIPAGRLRSSCPLDAAGQRLMEHAVTRLGLSARAHDRVLRVARTIADMEGADPIKTAHLAEAIQYRSLDRPV